VRWLSQIIFFSLFLFLLLRTEFRGSLHAGGSEIRLPYPVQLFFQFDPLVALSNALWNLDVSSLPYLKMASQRGLGTYEFRKIRTRARTSA
jgi:hypothetical protein